MDDATAYVRRVDEDRWLASRFADATVRQRLMAVYWALNAAARAADGVREPMLAQMRLVWWRDALLAPSGAGAEEATPPSLRGFRVVRSACHLDEQTLAAFAEARFREGEVFADWARLHAFVGDTAGAVVALALQIAAADMPTLQRRDLARTVGDAWGWLGLARVAPYWRAKGLLLPTDVSLTDLREALLTRAMAAYAEATIAARAAPLSAFSAIGYIALAPMYAKAIRAAPEAAIPAPALLQRQGRIVWAALTRRF